MLKAAIFDLDGTLVDSMWVWAEVDSIWTKRHQIAHTPELDAKLKTLPFHASAQYVVEEYRLPMTADEVIAQWCELAAYEYENLVKEKKGVMAFLSFLQKKKIAMVLATSCLKDPCYAVLSRTGLHQFFSHIFFTSDFHTTKSEPDLFRACAEKIGAAPQECVVFEDIAPALLGAKNAGMHTVAVYDQATSEPWKETAAIADGAVFDWTQAFEVWAKLEQST